jgi:hypothetical protein
MNIERVDPVVSVRQSPDVERVKDDRERRQRDEDQDDQEQGERSSAPPAEGAASGEPKSAEHEKHTPVVVYEPSTETGVRKHESEHDPTIDYKG